LEKSQNEGIDDEIALDFLSKLLKINECEVNDLFYLDDVKGGIEEDDRRKRKVDTTKKRNPRQI